MSIRKLLLISICFVLTGINTLFANPVDQNRARCAGAAFLSFVGHSNVSSLSRVDVSFKEFYVFQAGTSGFVLVSADDCVRPILGYSLTGEFVAGDMPSQIRGWLEGYEMEIARIKRLEQTNKSDNNSVDLMFDIVSDEWNRLSSGAVLEPQLLSDVSPLLVTTWNQKPLYNNLCPYDDGSSQRTVTGCVATATAQIMKYWNHPTTGSGSSSYSHSSYGTLSANFGATTYDWDNMPAQISNSSSTAEINAVAELMYHIGVAVEMDYDISANGGSSAQNYSVDGTPQPSAQFALAEYFKYSPDMAVVTRSGSDDESFSAILRAELDQNRPILYSGRSNTGGHSFVCDGYDAYNNFHFNWGWGGYCDGFYTIGALNPAPGGVGSNSTSTYNSSNVVVIGIRPHASFGGGGTVTVSKTGGTASCTVSGTGTYSNGETVTIKATVAAGSGYRFAEWSDHSHHNARAFLMTGGNYSFTARFESIGSRVMGYCGDRGRVTAVGSSTEGADKYWGIKLPSSALTVGHQLSALDFFAVGEGQFDVTVYKGTPSPSTSIFSKTVQVSASEADDWIKVNLDQNYTVESGKNIWIIVHNTDIKYPAAVTTSSGNKDGFLWGANYSNSSSWEKYSAMVRGYFSTADVVATGDTISYCDQNPYVTNSGAAQWGISIPASELSNRDYLKSVKLYATINGIYTLRVYQGGLSAPETLVHTQPVRITSVGWHEIALDQVVALNTSDPLWITFSCQDVSVPAAACSYAGNINSNWISYDGEAWTHLTTNHSWMIKAVTSVSAPTLPAPTVIVQGESHVAVGATATFSALHTTGTTVNWTISDATPSTATGESVTATWNQAGVYAVIVSVSNDNGVGTDTLNVNVVDCTQPVTNYPYTMGFEADENRACLITKDVDADGQTWESATVFHSGSRSYVSPVSSLASDNWLVLPPMQTREMGEYRLQWYQYVENGESVSYSVYIDTTGSEEMDYSVLLNTFNVSGGGVWQQQKLDLSGYVGRTIRLAFRCFGETSASVYLDDLSVSEIMFFHEGDTLSYCGDRERKGNTGYSSGTYWGVRFAPERLSPYDTIKSVMIYVTKDADYTLKILQGGGLAPETLRYSSTFTLGTPSGWKEIELPQPVVVDASQSLWITFSATVSSPACATLFTGDTNSDWISRDGASWSHVMLSSGGRRSWMIKAVMATADMGDTISYCRHRGRQNNVGMSSGATYYWGVRFMPDMLVGYDSIRTVRLYATKDADYTLNISQQGAQAPGPSLHSYTVHCNEQSGWNDIVLHPALPVDAGQPLWITFSAATAYPACATSYCGDTNSDWKSTDGTVWSHVMASGTHRSWMIQAVMAASGCVGTLVGDTMATACDQFSWYDTTFTESATATHTLPAYNGCDSVVTLHLTMTQYAVTAVSNDDAVGTVTGGDTYCQDSIATLTAVANEGFRFVQWSDGNADNPREIVVVSDTTFMAYFAPFVGFGDVMDKGVDVFLRGGQIVIRGVDGRRVTLTDALGRIHYRGVAAETLVVEPPIMGIYFIQVDGYPAKRVAVVR